ncbi:MULTISPECIES: lasso peptide biosynthesis PqqD family chaperone [unclassified Amycolatopsis]|uniref:lasso peptide biosynthesis PqqD family chaperone n=1 Tax=unclassified Amycolatopsis TaxID=2618356 RepID=UPI00106DFC98|nr:MULTISPECIES: lasso peptide biosynthesis PqqD family chaperone [unclassified Amycolatopsis]MCG3754331.1 lasso peptide biosynthesis PqqD family chaperone [Amycolatopsis sp. Poz14]
MTPVDDSVVLLDERKGRYWQLNSTAARILRELIAGGRPEDLRDRLAASAGADREMVEQDVRDFVQQLLSAGLVTGGQRSTR